LVGFDDEAADQLRVNRQFDGFLLVKLPGEFLVILGNRFGGLFVGKNDLQSRLFFRRLDRVFYDHRQ